MNSQVTAKTNFTSGQVSPQLYSRGDLKIFANGASKLQNVTIFPTGGISRRKGTRYIAETVESARMVSFEFNTEQTYLVVFEPQKVKIIRDDDLLATLESPWTAEQIKNINWTQSADTLLVVHPDVPPQQISRYDNEEWKLTPWSFYEENGKSFCPYFNFYKKEVPLHTSATSGNTILDADVPIFNQNWLGVRIRINSGECIIYEVQSATRALATFTCKASGTTKVKTWEEAAFSPLRGYPVSVTFHQDRMVIGGSRSLPNHIWLSKSSDLFNFDVGKGEDDEAIDFAILSDQVNAIVNVVSSRHLLVFTTGAEWMVSGDPLTPTSIQLRRQTNVGSYNRYTIQPQNVDGATLFISQTGKQLREFLYADVEQAYQAKDLTLLSADIIKDPIDITYHQDESILYIILADGTASCLTTYRTEEVTAWSKLCTDGAYKSAAVIGNDVYFIATRGDVTWIEKVEKDYQVDVGCTLVSDIPQKTWSGLDYLEGREVSVVADGFTVGKFPVINGSITLLEEAQKIIAGLAYEHEIIPLPFMVESAIPYFPKAFRLIYGVFRLLETQALTIDIGNGFCDVPLRKVNNNVYYDSPSEKITGDIELRSLGWIRNMNRPMWQIKSDKPCSFTLLGVVVEAKIKQ